MRASGARGALVAIGARGALFDRGAFIARLLRLLGLRLLRLLVRFEKRLRLGSFARRDLARPPDAVPASSADVLQPEPLALDHGELVAPKKKRRRRRRRAGAREPERIHENLHAIGTGEARREPQRAGEVRPRARHDADHAPAPARRRGGLRRRLVGGKVRGRRGTLAELGREAPGDAATFLLSGNRRGRRPTRRRGRRLVRRRGGGIIYIPVAVRFEGRTREGFRGRWVGRWVRTRRRRALARADVRSLLVRVRRRLRSGARHALVQELPRLARAYELLRLRVGEPRPRARRERFGASGSAPRVDHRRQRVVVPREASEHLQRPEPRLGPSRSRPREAEERGDDARGRVHVRGPGRAHERGAADGPSEVRAVARDVPELLAMVRAAAREQHLERDADDEDRALDLRGGAVLGNAAV